MALLGEIVGSIANPAVWLAGLGLAVILSTQEWRWRWRIVGAMIFADFVILASKFEIEAKHGLYEYQTKLASSEISHNSVVTNPGSIVPEQAHLAGVQLAGAILVTLAALAVVRLYRASKATSGN